MDIDEGETMDIQQQGIDAATAYQERTGQLIIAPDFPGYPEGVQVLGIDDGVLVGTRVLTMETAGEFDAPDATQLEALRAVLEDHRVKQRPELTGVRVDVISLLLIAEDRALLRHHRDARPE